MDKVNKILKGAKAVGAVVDTTTSIFKGIEENNANGATTSEYIGDYTTEIAYTGVNNAAKTGGAWAGAKALGTVRTYVAGPYGAIAGAVVGGIVGATAGDKISKSLLNKKSMSEQTTEVIDTYIEERKRVVEEIQNANSREEDIELHIWDSLQLVPMY